LALAETEAVFEVDAVVEPSVSLLRRPPIKSTTLQESWEIALNEEGQMPVLGK
jgi:hypothetical protein